MTKLPARARALLLPTALLMCLPTPVAQGVPDPAAPGWSTPACSPVIGDGAFTYTTDDGLSITPTTLPVTPQAWSHVAVLDRRDSLVGITKSTIQISRDAGCSWATIARPGNLSTDDVIAAGGDVAYVFGLDDSALFRIAGDHVQERIGPVDGKGVVGLAAGATRPHRLVAVGDAGQVFRSNDGGGSWVPVGKVPGGHVYDAAIDPADLDHIVLATGNHGAWTTFDGGLHWEHPRGLGKVVTGFSAAVSVADPQTVWVEGFDHRSEDNGARHIWRSVDGGRHFWSVLDGNDALLVNGPPLWPSPIDADVLYFAHGTPFDGTDLYRYDDLHESLTVTHNAHDGITSVAFNPVDASVMYLGLSEVAFGAR